MVRPIVVFVMLLVACGNGEPPTSPPYSTQPTQTNTPKTSFSRWGTGSGVYKVELSEGRYTCTFSVSGNRDRNVDKPSVFYVDLFKLGLPNIDDHNVSREIASEGRWQKSIAVDGGSYDLDVNAEGTWMVSCKLERLSRP